MTEKQIVNKLVKAIRKEFEDKPLLKVHQGLRIPYAFEITAVWNDRYEIHDQLFETDIAIVKEEGQSWKPRVVVEIKKGGNFNVHDLITYSEKAAKHKAVFPYLHYGFVIVHEDNPHDLRPLVHRHGKHFDFLCSVFIKNPTNFTDLLKKEVQASWDLERLLYGEKRCTILHRNLQISKLR